MGESHFEVVTSETLCLLKTLLLYQFLWGLQSHSFKLFQRITMFYKTHCTAPNSRNSLKKMERKNHHCKLNKCPKYISIFNYHYLSLLNKGWHSWVLHMTLMWWVGHLSHDAKHAHCIWCLVKTIFLGIVLFCGK